MRKAYLIVGPTAVGKTSLAIQLAKKINGELFSADSIQVYKGLDIISGKDLPLLKNTPIHLLDLSKPTDSFSVGNYLEAFTSEVAKLDPQKTLIIVGGTGYYIFSLLNGVPTAEIKPNEDLRIKFENKTVKELQVELKKLDSDKLKSMNNSDRNNPRRLIRAIEIAKSIEYPVLSIENRLDGYEISITGLKAPGEFLDKRIDLRVEQRLQDGAVEEAERLFKQYDKLAPQVKRANGYKQLFGYLRGEYDLPTAIERWKLAEHQNVKKQMTWFRKLSNATWFDISKVNSSQINDII